MNRRHRGVDVLRIADPGQRRVVDLDPRRWEREVERHGCTAVRLQRLLEDLGEPLDGPEAEDLVEVPT